MAIYSVANSVKKYGMFIWGILFFINVLFDNDFISLDIIIALEVILFFIYICYLTPNFIMRYLMLFFIAYSNLTGVFIVENFNIWLPELGIISHKVGSLALLTFMYYIFIATVWSLEHKFPLVCSPNFTDLITVKIRGKVINWQKVFLYFMIFISVLLLIHIFDRPYFMDSLDRFLYRAKYITGIWERISSWCWYCVPIGIIVFKNDKSKLAIGGIFLYCIFLFWSGEKFGGFFNILVIYCLIYSIKWQNENSEILHKIILYVGITFLIIISMVLLHNLLNYNANLNKNVEFILQRAAQQGQLWWRTYELDKGHGLRIEELSDEINVWYRFDNKEEERYNHAIYKIMRYTTPKDIFLKKISHKSRYSTSTYATLYYYFKEVGVFVYSLVGAILFWLFIRGYLLAIRDENIIDIFIYTKLSMLVYMAMTQSEFNLLFSLKPMFYRKHQGSVTDRRKFNPRLLEIVYVWDKIRQDLAGFGKKFQELADGNFYYYTMVMLLNAFIFAGVECEYVAEIQKIRQRIKDNLYSILVNNNITLKSKMACVLALLSMRLYKIICCNFVRSY